MKRRELKSIYDMLSNEDKKDWARQANYTSYQGLYRYLKENQDAVAYERVTGALISTIGRERFNRLIQNLQVQVQNTQVQNVQIQNTNVNKVNLLLQGKIFKILEEANTPFRKSHTLEIREDLGEAMNDLINHGINSNIGLYSIGSTTYTPNELIRVTMDTTTNTLVNEFNKECKPEQVISINCIDEIEDKLLDEQYKTEIIAYIKENGNSFVVKENIDEYMEDKGNSILEHHINRLKEANEDLAEAYLQEGGYRDIVTKLKEIVCKTIELMKPEDVYEFIYKKLTGEY